jgi:hypothetical protein
VSGAVGFLGTVLWWACVIGTYYVAKHKGRNRFGWTLAAVFVRLIALAIVAVLPRRVRLTAEGYHPDYRGLGT